MPLCTCNIEETSRQGLETATLRFPEKFPIHAETITEIPNIMMEVLSKRIVKDPSLKKLFAEKKAIATVAPVQKSRLRTNSK